MNANSVRWAVVTGTILLVGLGGWWVAGATIVGDGITWSEAAIGDLVIGVEVEGTLASEDSSMLGPPQVPGMWDFKISFMAPEGEEVSKGTPVLAFDASELERRLRDKQTESEEAAKNLEQLLADLDQQQMHQGLEIAEAEAKLRKAHLELDVPEDLASARELQEARLDVELAEREVEMRKNKLDATLRQGEAQRAVFEAQKSRADQQVEGIETAIQRMTALAPRAGTVIYVTNWREEKKKVGDSAWMHEEVIELPNLRLMMAKGEVDEADAARVAVGQPFRIRLDAHPEVEYTGAVESIWRTVRSKRGSRNPLKVVRLDLRFDETDVSRMRPGMRFRGIVETERLESVLFVPSRSVFPTADGPVVYRRTLFGFEKVRVSLGRRNESSVQVLEGLEPGDSVAETMPET